MSTTAIKFKTTLLIGSQGQEQSVPLVSEVVFGDGNSQDGVENGFIFKLDRQPGDPPIPIFLGDMIAFVEQQLGGGDLSQNPGMSLISQAFSSQTMQPPIDAANFNASNQTVVNLYELTLNSTTNAFLFAINMDVEGSDPQTGLIALPAPFVNWLKVESLAISFSATTKSST